MAAACASAAATPPTLAREFGTPLYAVAEDDLRGRAREFTSRDGRRRGRLRLQGLPLHRGPEGLPRGGPERRRRLRGRARAGPEARASPATGSSSTATRSPRAELQAAAEAGARIVVDNFDELDKLERARAPGRGDDPGHAGRRRRHPRRDPHRPRGLEVRLQPRAGARGDRAAHASALGGPARACTCTSGRSSSTSSRGGWRSRRSPRSATSAPTTSAAASRWPTRPTAGRRRVAEYVEHDDRHRRRAARPRQARSRSSPAARSSPPPA